jgi:hypothetical protein
MNSPRRFAASFQLAERKAAIDRLAHEGHVASSRAGR